MRPEFAEYHRRQRRAALPRRIVASLATAALLGGIGWAVAAQAAHPSQQTTDATTSTVLAGPDTAQPAPSVAPDVDAAGSQGDQPQPADAVREDAPRDEPEQAAPPSQEAPSRAQRHDAIQVATRGFQVELDNCQWVRMDIGAVAPIVGAHNYCDGDLVLQLEPLDLVTITGTDLDGDYQVSGSRDAQAGDDAATATAGLDADILLQTCYWGDAGLRLVALDRVDLSLSPTPAPAPAG